MASFARMGILFLNKRKLRMVMTICAIILGVGILTGVNVTADSIDKAINDQINQKLGQNDIIVYSNRSGESRGWFNYNDAKQAILQVQGVKSAVPRIIKSGVSYPLENSSSGWRTTVVALNTSDPNEIHFGKSNITAALAEDLVNTSRLEDLFQRYSHLQYPVVLSRRYADSFNLKPGDDFYLYPENPTKFGGGINATNTSTWIKTTIIGIIVDESEAVSDFSPYPRVWELTPPSNVVYIDLQDAWGTFFNDHENKVSMLFVSVQNSAEINQVMKRIENANLESIFPDGLFTENVKQLFSSGISQINFLMRGLFSIFSGISLLVCAIIIKNLLEMAKEEQMHEIGIMRAIGVTKGKIFSLYISQILFISVIGSAIGIGFGYYLSNFFFGSYLNTAKALGANFGGDVLTPVLTNQTITTGMAAGVLISLVFGFFPARAAANVDPLEALKASSTRPKQSLVIRTVKHGMGLSVALGFIIGGFSLIGSSFAGIFYWDVIDPVVVGLLFLGVVILIIGIVLLGAWLLPVIIPTLAMLLSPMLKQMRTITSRNLIKYSRQTKNTFAMLTVGLCMMITVGTIMNSVYMGAYPGGKTITGGDLRIGDLYNGQVHKNHQTNLTALPSVAQAVPIRFSFGFEGLTRVQTADNRIFGGKRDNIAEPIRESFHIGILDPQSYSDLHSKDSIVRIDKRMPLNQAISTLKIPYTIAIQDRLARKLNIRENDILTLRFEGFEANFTVTFIYEVLPGIYWSYYVADSTFDKQFTGIISWQSYEKLIEDNIGKADVIVRNKVTPPEEYKKLLPKESLWGYAHAPLDLEAVESLAYQTGLVEHSNRRIHSPFWSAPKFAWKTNFTLYDEDVDLSNYSSSAVLDPSQQTILNKTLALQNVLWHENGSIGPNWNEMFSRAVVINSSTDSRYGNTTITNSLASIPSSMNKSIDSIMQWAATDLIGENYCIVNEFYVNLNFSSGKWDYVKKFVPGEYIRIYYNDSIYSDFMVIATTNSHYNYQFQDSKGRYFGDTFVFNYKAMNFNTYTYNSSDWNYFFEVMDLDPNTILILDKGVNVPNAFNETMIPDLIRELNSISGGFGDNASTGDLWWLNQTLSQLYWLNSTPYFGNFGESGIEGEYNYNGTLFTINGLNFTINGSPYSINMSYMPQNNSNILQSLMDGNSTLQLENLTTSIMFDIEDNLGLEGIRIFIEVMRAICAQIPTLKDLQIFSPKLFMLEDAKVLNCYFLIGIDSKDNIDKAYHEIETYYYLHNLPWNDKWNARSTEIEEQVGGILSLIINMFFGVLSFALIASLLGLAISTVISVRKRYAEIGTLRTLGFSNKQILSMVVGEGVITALIGITLGTIVGLLIAFLIINNLPFMIFLPIVFAPPVELIGLGILLLIAASVAVSFLPATSAVRIDIAEAIRSKGE